ncbi:MAG: membrane protein insertase YidC, partial [Hydrogenimonas sp.]|nr:membrane protein insertase YidC [Hydrogenimonas sp.]
MIDKMSTQMRVLIATVLSLIVFIGYDFLFMPKQVSSQIDSNRSEVNKITDKSAPGAPVVPADLKSDSTEKGNSAPVVKSSKIETVLATVDTTNARIEFDALGRISQVYLKDRQYRDEAGEELKLFNSPKIPKPLEIRFSDPKLNELAFK